MKKKEQIKNTVVSTIIASMITNDLLLQIKNTPYYRQSVKNAVNKNLSILESAYKKEIAKFDEIGFDELTFFYNELYFLIQNISKTNLLDWQKLRVVIDAFNEHPDRMTGLATKILKEIKNKK